MPPSWPVCRWAPSLAAKSGGCGAGRAAAAATAARFCWLKRGFRSPSRRRRLPPQQREGGSPRHSGEGKRRRSIPRPGEAPGTSCRRERERGAARRFVPGDSVLRMFHLGSRLLFLPILLGMVYAAPASDGGGEEQPKEEIVLTFPRDQASLKEMFREVEELMEDTQYKLRNAVKEMKAEEEGTKRLTVDFEKLPANYHNESHTDTKIGNKTIHTHQEINEATDNKTGSTSYSETVVTSIQEGENKRNHECIIDEDCDIGKYCEFSGLEYKCRDCKTEHTHCSRDVECCGRQLCVWGECVKAVSRGENGTICESQHDCNPGMCCALSKDLLFPVCTPLAREREPCYDPSNRLLNLITWDLEPDGALDRCPCAHGFICQIQSHSSDSLCELSFNKTESEDEKPLVGDEISLLDFVTEDSPGDYERRLIKEVQKGLEEEGVDSKELDVASDLFFGDEI